MTTALSNPNGAHRTISDYTTGLDDAGNEVIYGPQEVHSWQAGSAIIKGQALMIVAPTTSAPPTVVPMTAAVTGGDSWRFVGAALESGAAGDQVRVCTEGICLVLHDAATDPAEYDLLELPGTTTGEFDGAGSAADDGVYAGYYLAGTGTLTDTALAMITASPIVRFEAGA